MVKSRREQIANTPINAKLSEGLVLNEQSPGFGAGHVAAGKGIVWIDNTTSPNRLLFTDETGVDHILGSASTLESVLAIGNSTGAYDIKIVNGQSIIGEPGVASDGGYVNIVGGVGTAGFSGGTTLIAGGNSYTGIGGLAILKGGDPNGGETASPAQVVAYGGNDVVGTGGNIDISAGSSPAAGEAVFGGGAINITAGDGINGNYGGDITVATGNANPLSLTSTSGDFTLYTGNGGISGGTGKSGNIYIATGDGSTTGDISFVTGVSSSGNGVKVGSINLEIGDNTSGLAGNINLNINSDDGYGNGVIDFQYKSASTVKHSPNGVTSCFVAAGATATVIEYGTGTIGAGIVELRQADQPTLATNIFLIHATNSLDNSGGTVIVSGGTAASGFKGGNIYLFAAPGNGVANGGDIIITSGASGSGASGNGGSISIGANNAASTNGDGGAAGIATGTGAGTGNGGLLSILAGDSGSGSTGDGASITVTAGIAASINGNGGSITIKPGSKTGSGTVGSVKLQDSAAAIKFEVNTVGIGFFASTPVARQTYTVTNPVTDRSFDTTTITTQNLAQVVGTIIADLQAYGLMA